MLKGYCKKYKKIVSNGKVIHYCFKIHCVHLKLINKKPKKGGVKNGKMQTLWERNYSRE